MAFEIIEHPVLEVPPDTLPPDEWMELHKLRAEAIHRERNDPLIYGWEPPIWKVCDALLGFDWVDKKWAEDMRSHLGFSKPVSALLINGGNRGGKSEYASKRVNKLLLSNPDSRAWAFHSSSPMSIEYQQPLSYKYMPPNLREKSIRTKKTYISYSQKNGFSDNKFVLPNGSEAIYRNYEQDIRKIEGGEIDIAWPDELVPVEWVETLMFRIATRNGKMIITFTPVDGYTPTVKLFQDGAEVAKEMPAFLLPDDTGDPLYEEALEIQDCNRWLYGETGLPPIPAGRAFKNVPRVLRCFEQDRAVVFFHTSDNPYGNPRSVLEKLSSATSTRKLERWFGVADKTVTSQFPLFKRKIHVVGRKAMPDKTSGTNYLFVDPSSGRNWFMTWFTFVQDDVCYVAEEFPGSYKLPDVGMPGPWAVPDGKKKDGKKGPAQNPFGYGYMQYKKLIAEIEGWHDAKKEKPDNVTDADFVKSWSEDNGADWPIEERFIDSRNANVNQTGDEEPTTILEELAEWGIDFTPIAGRMRSSGQVRMEGVQEINDRLSYDRDREIDYFNRPKLLVGEWCGNTIFSLETWSGLDGTKGACKDPIDNLRYCAQSGAEYYEQGAYESAEGGSW